MKSLAVIAFMATPALADSMAPRDGWRVIDTAIPYADLLTRLSDAIKAEKMITVTKAGPTAAAASRGIEIPGNRVVGVYRNDFAVRNLAASTASGIEAPIRFYVTEDGDGSATLSWKTPGHVFAPYMDEGGPDMAALASELDAIFEAIATRATAQ
jgi:uncharacterized protein (DUF302 family)